MTQQQTISDQIKAIEAWALRVKEHEEEKQYSEIGNITESIYRQARKLLQRKEGYGLKDLPELDEVKTLREDLTQVEAACKMITKNLKTLPSEDSEKEGLKIIARYIAVLFVKAEAARRIIDREPWFNVEVLTRQENVDVLCDVFRKKGFYGNKEITEHMLRVLHGVAIKNVNFAGKSLKKAYFRGVNFDNCHFDACDMQNVIFYYSGTVIFRSCSFRETRLSLDFYSLASLEFGGCVFSGNKIELSISLQGPYYPKISFRDCLFSGEIKLVAPYLLFSKCNFWSTTFAMASMIITEFEYENYFNRTHFTMFEFDECDIDTWRFHSQNAIKIDNIEGRRITCKDQPTIGFLKRILRGNFSSKGIALEQGDGSSSGSEETIVSKKNPDFYTFSVNKIPHILKAKTSPNEALINKYKTPKV
tara:strand:+ start:291 stop:1547 length:1257 start_codon:yes stop_codon:yes gene_type:complete